MTRRSLSSGSGHGVLRVITGQRITQPTPAINDELRQPAPDAQRVELPGLPQTGLRRIRDKVTPDDARTIARHVVHSGRIVRGHAD
ncbi:hypothetical protein [Paraburkholderia kururiensis]|uniref:hypothetical protein n=1 Tax=Paraburkholderia kururiensis TaxID=984307 RepID=UPI000AEAE04F|nr:hypothetical protein [Paraburkholderia kururiensis]